MHEGNLRGQIPQAYSTVNAALAITLHLCGVPFAKVDGITLPGFNLYSIDHLRSFKDVLGFPKYHGWNPDKAIASLFNSGKPGQIVYQFERLPNSTAIAEIEEGWQEMAEAIKNADSANPDATTGTATLESVSPKQVAMICCQYAKTRKLFFGDKENRTEPLWRRRDAKGNLFMPAVRAAEGASRTDRDGEKTIVYGSMKLQGVRV